MENLQIFEDSYFPTEISAGLTPAGLFNHSSQVWCGFQILHPSHPAFCLVLPGLSAGHVVVGGSKTVAAPIASPGKLIMFSMCIVVNKKALPQPLSYVTLTIIPAGRHHSLSFYRRGKYRYCLPKFSHPVLCLQASTQYSTTCLV